MPPNKSAAVRLFVVAHAVVPGRIRVRVPLLRRNTDLRALLERELRRSSDVHTVEASTVTSTVLILGSAEGARVALARLAELLGSAEPVEAAAPAVTGDAPSPGPRLETLEEVAKLRQAVPESLRVAFHQLVGAVHRGGDAVPAPVRGARARAGSRAASPPFHSWPEGELLAHFSTELRGLGDAEARRRYERDGANVLQSAAPRSELAIFLDQLTSVPVLLLAGSAVLSVATGGVGDAIVILAVVTVNASIGYVTESHAEKVIRSLEQGGDTTARVLRDGLSCDVPIEQVVVGDVLVLGPGMSVAADARVVSSDMLLIDESALTGESVPVLKASTPLPEPLLPLADRTNMAFRGTLVTGGSGLALVVAVGGNTEIGTIQALAGEVQQRQTPLQEQLDRLGIQIVIASGVTCGAVFAIGLLRGYPFLQMLKVSISLAVAAVPEGLPTVASTTLALGIRHMQELNVHVRHLSAVETLGAIQVMCLDKTGTITVNRMTVVALLAGMRALDVLDGMIREGSSAVDVPGDAALVRLLEVVTLCNETELTVQDGAVVLTGSSTEAALVRLAADAGVDVTSLRQRYPLLATRYRSETRAFMSTLHTAGEFNLLAVKGRASEVLAMCTHELRCGQVVPLSDEDRRAIALEEERMASRALRVLGAAFADGAETALDLETSLTWVGLVGMSDPPREGLPELMRRFHGAGIETVMITGDQSATACAIGRKIGLARDGRLDVLDSNALDQLDPTVLSAMAQRAQIFSRVSPAHKLQIVQALQRAGRVVAMTGDGINDSPALKAADVGVAMGAGTSAAREMADVVLQDDNLGTMITAIEQGRTIYDDIKKAVRMMISKNSSEILLMLASVAAGLGDTLTPMQLLWINVVTDIFPELALAVQPPDSDVLGRPPRDAKRPMFERAEFARMGVEGTVLTASAVSAMLIGRARYGPGLPASTMTLTSMITAHMLHTITSRSERHSIFDADRLPRNPHLAQALGVSLGIHVLATLIPGTRRLLNLTIPAPLDLATSVACGVAPFIVNELLKLTWRTDVEQPPGELAEAV